ncbi:heparinase II/III domain-containing protein [Falsibacillus albus]|uniref:Uncharacterized protein n=1 Tax=Falsibacillus albus TaxID=2478915 RepID=A0A3L7JZ17_9BACI|nr:heparinase II/III family protein [Falsibacillus albus]RLQ96128.1 hypothetical protein D9X91_07485 [Falsibacillus albus]
MKRVWIVLICICTLCSFIPIRGHAESTGVSGSQSDEMVISDFESLNGWRGLSQETDIVKEGVQAGYWDVYDDATDTYKNAVDDYSIPHDWSNYEAVSVWVYSKKATNDKVYIVLGSQASEANNGYYLASFQLDWTGWKEISIPFYMFKAANSPAGFSKIDFIKFHTSWLHETPSKETEMILDSLSIKKLSKLAVLPVDDFEDPGKWTSLTASTEHVKSGTYSGKWEGIDKKKVVQSKSIPSDWSKYDYLSVWVYSEKATGTSIYIILNSDNPATEGLDYYLASFNVDWVGWKQIKIPRSSFAPSRQPLGWDHISDMKFHSQWYADQMPDPSTVLYFDHLMLIRELFQITPNQIDKKAVAGMDLSYKVKITNKGDEQDQFNVDIPDEFQTFVHASPESGDLQPNESKWITFSVNIGEEAAAGTKQTMDIPIRSQLQNESDFNVKLSYEVAQWAPSGVAHPKSFINQDQLDRAKARITSEDWAKTYWNKLKSEADEWVSADTKVLTDSGGHGMWFLCDDGERLQYDSNSPHEHYCPSEDKYYTGETYDAGWRYYRHNEIVHGLKVLATAYALSGDTEYAEAAAGILDQYADIYPNWEKQTRGGKMYWQSLDESVSMVDMSYSYDLIYNSGILSDQEKANIELNLLRASAENISQNDMDRSNWQAWHNAAIGMVGFVLGDRGLMESAINGNHGFYYQMKNSVLDDGFWWEGSIAYHMYTLRALNYLIEGAENWGYDLYADPNVKKMFDVPIEYAYPNLQLPFNNDGGGYGSSLLDPVSTRGDYEYEGAFAYYKDPLYDWVLQQRYRNVPREGDYALFHGADDLGEPVNTSIPSHNFENAGMGILRAGTYPEQNYVLMDYGPYGGSHGHADKLHIDLFGKDTVLAPDFGTPSYGNSLYQDWYKQTISHNTVAVDGKSQAEVAGELTNFIDLPHFKMMSAAADNAYPGVQYERTIWVDPNYTVDWFKLSDPDNSHQYDWAIHPLGSLQSDLVLQDRSDSIGDANGYQHISNVQTAGELDQWEGSWDQKGKELQAISLPFGQREVMKGDAPGPADDPNKNVSMVIQREQANDAQFVTVFHPYNEEAPSIQAQKEDDNTIKIDGNEQSDHLYFNSQANEGALWSAKVTTSKDEAVSFKEIQSSINGQTLEIHLGTHDQLWENAVFVFKSGDVKKVKVNGADVSYEKIGNQIIVSSDAIQTISRDIGKPIDNNWVLNGGEGSLIAAGNVHNPIEIQINNQKQLIPPNKGASKVDLSPFLVEGENRFSWEAKGKPDEQITMILTS